MPGGAPFRHKAALCYNYYIAKHSLPLMPISSGAKIMCVYVTPDNPLKCTQIAFVGNWPDAFNGVFKIDYEKMWLNNESLISKWYEILKFGKPQKQSNSFSSFFG
jgi:hypothetical protein